MKEHDHESTSLGVHERMKGQFIICGHFVEMIYLLQAPICFFFNQIISTVLPNVIDNVLQLSSLLPCSLVFLLLFHHLYIITISVKCCSK